MMKAVCGIIFFRKKIGGDCLKKFWILLGLVLNVFWLAPMSVSAEWEEPPTTVIEEATYYQLDSAEDLKWFADQVNGGNTSIHAILTADITLNSNVLAEDGSLNGDGSGFSVWTPIFVSSFCVKLSNFIDVSPLHFFLF